LIDRKLLIASLNAQVPARDYLASFVKSDRLLGAGYATERITVDGRIALAFESSTVLGFVFTYELDPLEPPDKDRRYRRCR
jgi:hypothetical protein